ncbi:MAG TPA: SRPBCC domain-containing protein [Cyclobacteriaceae bacterium]|nr:SRPBCC domain-containing protein [Cyclobacteriaceae bacterium]
MKTELVIRNSIKIKASPAKVWNALVNPEETRKYMFGCEAVSDWKLGSPLIWKGSYEGKDMIFVKGKIVGLQPEKFLAYTAIDPNSSVPDIPENYLTVTYTLTEEGEQTLLSVTQGDYATVADGEKRYNDSNGGGEGWNPILLEIKKLVEKV